MSSGDTEPASTAAVTARVGSDDGWSSDESKQGTVSLQTYRAYVNAVGGVFVVAVVVFASFVAEGAKGFNVWWLAYWLEQGSGTANVSLMCIWIYMKILSVITSFIYELRSNFSGTVLVPSLF